MISVIMFGRNDSHGYNMHKRVAMSLNCLAQMLDDTDDEIIFVDCNTRDDLPTLPETIADTLTDKARNLLRIFRIRPSLFAMHNKGSRLPVQVALSMNVGARRSNPKNKWILSGTSDIVVVPRSQGDSITSIVRDLPSGFYELPRFGVPESLWGSLRRNDPENTLLQFSKWGVSLRLNNVVKLDRPDILFDNPGDFQLVLREQFFAVQGFDERMTRCWHHDSNLARRLYLLNGETRSFLDRAYSYHCEHTWEADYLHDGQLNYSDINDVEEYILKVTTPYQPYQAESWGLPSDLIEEISLSKSPSEVVSDLFEAAISPSENAIPNVEYQCGNAFNNGVFYDPLGVLPYMLNSVFYRSSVEIVYLGKNSDLVRGALSRFVGQEKRRMVPASPKSESSLDPDVFEYRTITVETDIEKALKKDLPANIERIFVVDFLNPFLEKRMNFQCILEPVDGIEFQKYKSELLQGLDSFIDWEKNRLEKDLPPTRFVFFSPMNTWGQDPVYSNFNLVLTAYGTHTMYGSLKVPKKRDREMEELKRRSESLENELNSIQLSRSWKVVCFVKKLKIWLGR